MTAYNNRLRLCATAASGDKTVLGFTDCAGDVVEDMGEMAGDGVCVIGGDWIGAAVVVVDAYWLSSRLGVLVYGRFC